MKRLLGLALGILTAIGGFLDIGDLVTNAVVGSRFGLSLAWVVVVGVVGICLFAQMSGKVAAVSGRATFEIIRERLGPRTAGANLAASFLINLLTLTAEVGGIALALQLASSVEPRLWIPVAGLAVWLVVWRTKFSIMENVTGLVGLTLVVFAVAVFQLGPDWSTLADQAFHPTVPAQEGHAVYWYYAIALFGAAMTPYEVFFFSSGAVEEKWTVKDLSQSRLNVLVGFPFGGILSVAIAACAAIVLPARRASRSRRCRRSSCRSRWRAASWHWPSSSSASWRPRSGLRWRRRCRAATPSRSSWGGPGASSAGRRTPRGST